jgi:hypothetical protein
MSPHFTGNSEHITGIKATCRIGTNTIGHGQPELLGVDIARDGRIFTFAYFAHECQQILLLAKERGLEGGHLLILMWPLELNSFVYNVPYFRFLPQINFGHYFKSFLVLQDLPILRFMDVEKCCPIFFLIFGNNQNLHSEQKVPIWQIIDANFYFFVSLKNISMLVRLWFWLGEP